MSVVAAVVQAVVAPVVQTVQAVAAPVVKAVEAVANVATEVVSSVGNVVEDAGNFVAEKVVEPVAKAVEKTIEAAIEDPVGTAVKVYALSTGNPLLIAAANTTVALANGADMNQALEAGGKAVIFSEIAQNVGEYVQPKYIDLVGPENLALAKAAADATASVAATAAIGGDPYEALVMSGAGSAANLIAKQVPGYETLSPNQQKALKTTIAAELQGKDASQALINQALKVGINYVKNDPEIQNIIPASTERKPTTQEEIDALINGGLTEDGGLNYGYEQAPDFVPEIDKKPTEVITAPVTTELPPPEQQDLPTAPESDTKLSEAQKDYLESSMAGGDDEVISDILDRQLSPLVPGDATPLPPVAGVDLTQENIVPEGVDRVPTTQDEVDALIGSGLVEDTGTDYGYEQAAPEEVTAPVDTGLTEDAGLDYGYEQAPDLSPSTEDNASPFPPATNVDLAAENIVPEGVDRVPTTQDEVDALIDSGLVETPAPPTEENLVETPAPPVESIEPTAPDSGESLSEVVVTSPKDDLESLIESGLVEEPPSFIADYGLSTGKDPLGLEPSNPAEVFAPDGSVNYDLTGEETGLGLQNPEAPNLESMGGGQGLTAPEFNEPSGAVSEQNVIDLLINSGLVEELPTEDVPSLEEVVVTASPEEPFEPLDPLDPLIPLESAEVSPRPVTPVVAPSLPTTPTLPVNPSYAPQTPDKPTATATPRRTSSGGLDDITALLLNSGYGYKTKDEDLNVVKASPYFDIAQKFNPAFFDELDQLQNKNTPDPQRVVRIASGGYMDTSLPQQQMTMDEILQILEGKYHG